MRTVFRNYVTGGIAIAIGVGLYAAPFFSDRPANTPTPPSNSVTVSRLSADEMKEAQSIIYAQNDSMDTRIHRYDAFTLMNILKYLETNGKKHTIKEALIELYHISDREYNLSRKLGPLFGEGISEYSDTNLLILNDLREAQEGNDPTKGAVRRRNRMLEKDDPEDMPAYELNSGLKWVKTTSLGYIDYYRLDRKPIGETMQEKAQEAVEKF